MPIYTIDIPDEAVAFVKGKFGQDMPSYIEEKLIRPLMDHFEEGERQNELAKVQTQIRGRVDAVKQKIKLEKKNDKNK